MTWKAFFIGTVLICGQSLHAQTESDLQDKKLKEMITLLAQNLKESINDFIDSRGEIITTDPEKEKYLLEEVLVKFQREFEDRSVQVGKTESALFAKRVQNMEDIAREAGVTNAYIKCRLFSIADNSPDFYMGAAACNPLPHQPHSLCRTTPVNPAGAIKNEDHSEVIEEETENDIAQFDFLKKAQPCDEFADARKWKTAINLIRNTRLPELPRDNPKRMQALSALIKHLDYLKQISDPPQSEPQERARANAIGR